MRLKKALITLALLFVVAPAPASADTTRIQADPQKAFKHRLSGIVVAAAAAGVPRTSVEMFDDKQLDFAAVYRSADDAEITTVYIFRKVTGDVPLWFDRIQRTVEARKEMASPTVAIPAAPFIPAGQPNARALRIVYAPGGPPWKSSAAALTSTGEWYVAVRASSRTLAPEQMLARVEQTFAAIKWPREKVGAPDAYQVADCPAALPQGENAEPVKDDGSLVLMAALVGNVGDSIKGAVKAGAPRWCRDPFKMTGAGVYRPDGASDRYFVAYQDAGRGIMVQPNGLAGLLAEAKTDAPLTYMVELIGIDRRTGLGSFKTLPSFAQAVWLNDQGTRFYSTTTWGKDKTIEVNSDAIK